MVDLKRLFHSTCRCVNRLARRQGGLIARIGRWAAVVPGGALPSAARAHSFGTPYTLPVPLWIYAYGCAATLILTFALLAWFRYEPEQPARLTISDGRRVPAALLWLLRIGAMACLALTIWAGFAGTADPSDNIAMTLFWILFLLGLAWLTLFAGNLYALANPWSAAIGLIERCGADLSKARVAWPAWLGRWPAFLLYVALIYLELFTSGVPFTLACALVVYSFVALVGAALFGKHAWFAQGDLFAIYFETIGRLAPVDYRRASEGGWTGHFRTSVLGALDARPPDLGMVLFILFMLSSTAYDSIHDTELWTSLFWTSALSWLLPVWGGDLAKAQEGLMEAFRIYRWAGLLVFPFLYFGLYRGALQIGRWLAPEAPSAGQAARIFAFSLVPIGVAYGLAHYYAFVVVQLHRLPALFSDPLGEGWNLLGIAPRSGSPALDMGVIWHVQVGAILLGHVVGVRLAHRIGVRVMGTGRGAILGQLPLLALMVVYTIFGLWILSLPLG